MTPAPAIVVLGPGGLATARRLSAALPGARVHGLEGRVAGAEVAFAETARHLRALFAAGHPIVGVCAAGVLIRALAPALADKRREPPVVAVAEDGSAAVPLLGGHHGANRLAREIAQALGGVAAVTTAGDLRLGLALDEPPPGWRLGNPEAVKAVTAALLSGAPVALTVEAGDAAWIEAGGAVFAAGAELRVRLTDRAIPGSEAELVLHPATLAVGVGCERGVAAEELMALVAGTLERAGLAAASVACLVSLDLKQAEPALHRAAEALGVPARFFDAATLEAERPRLANPSPEVFRAVGCHGVAEGAALAAAGPDGALVVPKAKSARATCAVARAPGVIAPEQVGRARGRLDVVGIGPGEARWRSEEATAALMAATDLVGYRRYLELLGPLAEAKRRHAFELGEEERRARHALDLAAAGARVALVSSGDAGIYAMASLVFELLEREGRGDWERLELRVIPGISALQAAAARAGAPLGHDFCAISLSDLLTPWPEIERRLEAAGAGDFAVALFNPASQGRAAHLGRARKVLLRHRDAATPVVLARNLGRDGEAVTVTTLGALGTGDADMLTTVLVGSRSSRRFPRAGGGEWVYTPRGYDPEPRGEAALGPKRKRKGP